MTFPFKRILGLWLVLLPLLLPPPALAQEPIQLVLHSLPLQDDRLLVVTVQLENVTDLYGAEIQLRYDPSQLKARDEDPRLEGVQIAPGPLLAFDDRFVALNQADAQTGLVDFVFTQLKPALPINEDGVLATVAFEVIGTGPLKVEVTEAKFASSRFTAIPVVTTNLVLAGPQTESAAQLQPAVAVSPFGWAIAGIVGVVVLAFVLLQLLPRPEPATGPQPVRRMPGVAPLPTRTAALLTEQAYQAMQQYDLPQAYERFSQAIELDPASAAAWLGKGLAAQQPTEKRICFQRALALEPGNVQAQAELQQLDTPIEGLKK
ncbi:MAG: hypothetical protein HC875_22800 [Anaerolineales bacterium]|nr:hypothetical protein [Anaerolineales bacterium]